MQVLTGSWARRRLTAAVGSCLFVLLACAGVASAAPPQSGGGSGYYVTFVARYCPAYTDIYANRARNDIQESLKDLGPDSQYPDSGFLVNPDAEGAAPQSLCKPLRNWQFTLGTGIKAGASTGPWGSLSIVTNPYSTAIHTQASTRLLNQNGQPVGRERIRGATTIELTKAQRTQASNPDQLWAQGGTTDDPVLAQRFPGPQYGFGALRCATDALNGDNVEFIYFPAGVTHVFCYGLYVEPPPTSGTITIKKAVTGAPLGDNPSFPFNGTLSYNPDGFALANGGSLDFYRAGGATWDVTEGSVDGYRLSSLHCTSATGESTANISGSTAAIHLADSDHVTCTFTNQYVPPTGGLTIRKVTVGGVGTFGYSVTAASGQGETHHLHATTTDPRVPVDAVPSLDSLAPGAYVIRERTESSPDGHWRLVGVRCDGAAEPTSGPVHVEVRSGEATTCTFVNAFIPRGAISIAKITTGGVGTATFLVQPHAGPPAQYLQHATTTAEGVAVDATPATAADATDHLRLGSYTITEQVPPNGGLGGWALTYVQCNGISEPFAQGAVQVQITRDKPSLHCVFGDFFTPNPPPIPPPIVPPTPPTPPTPPVPPVPPPPFYARADLDILKQATPSVVVVGHVISYRVTVHNRGPDPAQRVAVWDQPLGDARIVSIHNPAGKCQTTPRPICRLGTLRPGAQVVIRVGVIPAHVTHSFTNRAVVGSATIDTNLRNNVARASVRVIAPPAPPPPGRG